MHVLANPFQGELIAQAYAIMNSTLLVVLVLGVVSRLHCCVPVRVAVDVVGVCRKDSVR
jgi:hypothetical protein